MNDNIYVFGAVIYKYGTNEKVKDVQVLAGNLFQATHILVDWVYGEDSHFREPVEIGEIRRIRDVNYIINPDFLLGLADDVTNDLYDGKIPLSVARKMDDSDVMLFNCGECSEKLRVPKNMEFPYVTCPNCSYNNLHSGIKQAGGMYYYVKPDDDHLQKGE